MTERSSRSARQRSRARKPSKEGSRRQPAIARKQIQKTHHSLSKAYDRLMTIPISYLLVISGVVHLALIMFSEWQDRNRKFPAFVKPFILVPVKFTDVDYAVFTDAARHVLNGGSPYDRHTYRYTPLLAWVLVPNVTILASFGKLLFAFFDLVVGYMIYRLTRGNTVLSSVWLFSPVALGVASRGSCDSIICALVLSLVFFVENSRLLEAALVFGFSVHLQSTSQSGRVIVNGDPRRGDQGKFAV